MKRLLFILTLLSFSLISCQVDELGVDNPGSRNEKGFSLSYRVNGAYSALTKSVVDLEEGEDNINSFYILFFENTTGGTGTFIEAIDINPYNETLLSTGVIDIVFPENSGLNSTTNYNLLLCANINEYTKGKIGTVEELKAVSYGLTENEVIRTLIEIEGVDPAGRTTEAAKIDEQEDNRFQLDMYNLPMAASTVKYANESELTVDLIRSVSRFDVVCDVEGATLVSASVWNAYSTTTTWETQFTNFSGARTERFYGVKVEDESNQINGSLYAFENYVKAPVQNDKFSTCLIVGIKRSKNTKTEYFRININDTSLGQQLKRNNSYCTIIKHLNSVGDDTERDAYENENRKIEYLILEKPLVTDFSAGGGFTEDLTVYASGSWKATIWTNTYTTALFEAPDEEEEEDENEEPIDEDDGEDDSKEKEDKETGVSTWTSAMGSTFYVKLAALKNLGKNGEAVITVTLDSNNTIKDSFTLTQRPLSTDNVVIQCRWAGQHGTLFNLKKDPTRRFVYNLATNMRNKELFGASTTALVQMQDEFVFLREKLANDKADIYQLTYHQISSAQYGYLNTWHAKSKNRLLFFTSKNLTQKAMNRYVNKFNVTGSYTVEITNAKAEVERRFNPAANPDHPLIKYLLETGPATDGKIIDRAKIIFKSKGSVNRALSSWPETFIPIIMAGGNDQHCVFGIDPVNRFIFLGDPAIFGSYTTKDLNYSNFNTGKTENEHFMNNFIAWMTRVAIQGDTFLNDFK